MNNHEFSQMAAAQITEGLELLDKARSSKSEADWKIILNKSYFWSVSNDKNFHSVTEMSPEDIRKSIIEDLIFVKIEQIYGAHAYYPAEQIYRHLDGHINNLLILKNAFDSLVDDGFISVDENKHCTIPANKINEAQDYSGVYIMVGFDDRTTSVGNIINVGGSALLAEIIEDMADDLKL
jgi:hypothetical protein